MTVLDLFCGKGGWSKGFAENGFKCTGIDKMKKGYPFDFIRADLHDWIPQGSYDVIVASPPCTELSDANMRLNGKAAHHLALDLVWRTFWIIQTLKPRYYFIENVKNLSKFIGPPNDIIQYGPTKKYKMAYLWTNAGKLPMFDKPINRLTSRKDWKQPWKMALAEIPLEMSRAAARLVKENIEIVKA